MVTYNYRDVQGLYRDCMGILWEYVGSLFSESYFTNNGESKGREMGNGLKAGIDEGSRALIQTPRLILFLPTPPKGPT